MLKFYLRDRRTFFLLAADIILVLGVIYYKWNLDRLIMFYCFSLLLSILSYLVYQIILSKYHNIFSALLSAVIIVPPVYFIAKHLISFPYFDFAIFTMFIVVAHAFDVKRYLSYKSSVANYGFALYVGLLFFLLPVLYYLPQLLSLINIPNTISTALTFVLVRNFAEYQRYRKFIEIENEIKLRQYKYGS